VSGRNPVRDCPEFNSGLVEIAFSQAKWRAVGTQSYFVYLHIYRVPTARCWNFHLFSTSPELNSGVSLTGHALATPPILYSMTKTVRLIINNLHHTFRHHPSHISPFIHRTFRRQPPPIAVASLEVITVFFSIFILKAI